jgi:hypothetical protein
VVKSVLTRVVFPRPDSPVVCSRHLVRSGREKTRKRTDNHHGEVCTTLCYDFVFLLMQKRKDAKYKFSRDDFDEANSVYEPGWEG